MLPALERLSGARLVVWRAEGRRLEAIAGAPDDAWSPPLLDGREASAGEGGCRLDTPRGPAWFEPVADVGGGVWLEIDETREGKGGKKGRRAPVPSPPSPPPAVLAEIVGSVLAAERDAVQVAAELSDRYEEIDFRSAAKLDRLIAPMAQTGSWMEVNNSSMADAPP